MNFKNGDVVKVIQPEIKGVIVAAQYDATNGTMQALVETNEGDMVHQRWVQFDSLELAETSPVVAE